MAAVDADSGFCLPDLLAPTTPAGCGRNSQHNSAITQ